MATNEHKATVDEILMAFRQFAYIAAHTDDASVERALQTVSTAESVGFMVDPTAYRTALFSGSLERQRKVIQLFARTKAELKALFPKGWPA